MGSDPFTFVFKYAWFIVGFLSLTQLVTAPSRARAIARRTGENEEPVRSFLYRYAVFTTPPFFVLGVLQLLGGFDDLFYIFWGPIDNPFVIAAILFVFAWWGIGAYFVFFRGAAKQIGQYGIMSRGGYTMSEITIKLLTVGVLIFLAVWLFVGRLVFSESTF